mgnify:FL=1
MERVFLRDPHDMPGYVDTHVEKLEPHNGPLEPSSFLDFAFTYGGTLY